MKKIFLVLAFVSISIFTFGQQTVKSQIDFFGLITTLMDFKNSVSESFYLTRSWVFIDKMTDTPEKIKLKDFCENGVNRFNERIESYVYLLDTTDLISIIKVKESVNNLIEKQRYTMNALKSFESYDDPLIVFDVLPPVEYGGEVEILTDMILKDLDKLIQKKTIEYIEFIGRQSLNQSSIESLKTKKIKELLNLLNVSSEIKDILKISNRTGLNRDFLEKDIYEILLQKYDKYYTISEIDDLIAFYKTKTGKRMIKVSKKMMVETLTEIMNTLN
jgi:hypothetical protein